MRQKKQLIVFLLIGVCVINFSFAKGEKEVVNNSIQNTLVKGQDNQYDWLIADTDDYITLIDSYDNQVTIKKPIRKIIVHDMGSALSSIRALDAQDLVVASNSYVKKNATFFPKLSKLPIISEDSQAVDSELILQLQPDLILSRPFYLEQLKDVITSEIPIVQLTFNSLESYKKLGAILDKEAEANEFINWIKSYTDIIERRISTLDYEDYQEVFVYYGGEYGLSDPPPYGTFGKDNFLRNDLIMAAGGKSITSNIPGDWIDVDPEWIIKQNPPLIIRECYVYKTNPELGYGINNETNANNLINNILNEQVAFENSDAVKNKNVHLIYGDLIEDSWFISLVYLAKWFHPDLFSDLDPKKMHQEYLTRFQKLDFDLEKQGLFTYSAIEGEY